jgi:hypothetical protein
MNYETDYVVVEGYRTEFEDKLNELSEEMYIISYNVNAILINDEIKYSAIMSKTTKKNNIDS